MSERADRILDAAAELLVQLGFRKVTIEDIAQRAGIGKGTVYLHWRTKQQLFEALFLREAVVYIRALNEALRRDPATARPHLLLAASYEIVTGNPVLRTLFSGDPRFIQSGLADIVKRSQELMATGPLYETLIRHGLLRADLPNLEYSLTAVHAGFYLLDAFDPRAAAQDTRTKAESLAQVVRHAFEPPGDPGEQHVADAAAELLATFEELVPPYEKWIYGED